MIKGEKELPDVIAWELMQGEQILNEMGYQVEKKATLASRALEGKGTPRILRVRFWGESRAQILYSYFQEDVEKDPD